MLSQPAKASDTTSTATTLARLDISPKAAAPEKVVLEKPLVELVIDEAMKSFVEGRKIHKDLYSHFEKNPQLTEKLQSESANSVKLFIKTPSEIRTTLMRIGLPFLQYQDEYFQSYNANRINTHFIAAEGPDLNELAEFFKSTIFNERLEKPITEIIALGRCLGVEHGVGHTDFYDYCSGAVKEFIVSKESAKPGDASGNRDWKPEKLFDVKVQAERISGIVDRPIDKKRFITDIIRTKLNLSLVDAKDSKEKPLATRQIHVTTYGLPDNFSINLTTESTPDIQVKSVSAQKEVLWQLFKKTLSETILIHCAAGVGRTGHLILTFELLKHHNEIYASQDPTVIAAKILEVVARIRENRPSLIMTSGQFIGAIRNAEILYRFALENRYIQAGMPVYESALAMPAQNDTSTPVDTAAAAVRNALTC